LHEQPGVVLSGQKKKKDEGALPWNEGARGMGGGNKGVLEERGGSMFKDGGDKPCVSEEKSHTF